MNKSKQNFHTAKLGPLWLLTFLQTTVYLLVMSPSHHQVTNPLVSFPFSQQNHVPSVSFHFSEPPSFGQAPGQRTPGTLAIMPSSSQTTSQYLKPTTTTSSFPWPKLCRRLLNYPSASSLTLQLNHTYFFWLYFCSMLHPPSGTCCQTSFIERNTLLLFGSAWNQICFQLYTPPTFFFFYPTTLPPISSSPYPHLPPLPSSPPLPHLQLLCLAQQGRGLLIQGQNARYDWTLTWVRVFLFTARPCTL